MCCITLPLCPVPTTLSLLETMNEASVRVSGPFRNVDMPMNGVMVTILNGETEHDQGFGRLGSPSFLSFIASPTLKAVVPDQNDLQGGFHLFYCCKACLYVRC